MVSEGIPLEQYQCSLAKRWIPANSRCFQNSEYLTNTFIAKASAFPEAHLCNRQGMALVLSIDEDYWTLLNDLHYMFGEQGLAKLYLCHKDSEHRHRKINEENLRSCLIWLRQSPTKWRLEIQFAKVPKGQPVIKSENGKHVTSVGSSGGPHWQAVNMGAGNGVDLLPSDLHQQMQALSVIPEAETWPMG